jgi:hypothetical protein
MLLHKPDGTPWVLERGDAKLALRATLPGARVFDLAAGALRKARSAGLTVLDRLPLALPASWCVNSPADSRILRRWTLSPQREVWEAVVDLLEEPRAGAFDAEATEALRVALGVLGPEPRGLEAITKVLALLVPGAVPLLPDPARTFLLGAGSQGDAKAFVAVVEWFAPAVEQARELLAGWAAGHREASLDAAQVLDRLLWFDSEGHRHFKEPPAPADAAATPASAGAPRRR